HRALRRRGGAPARRVRAPRARGRSPARAALEHHHVAALPARAWVRRAARRAQGARLCDLRGTGVVREGGVSGGEHGRVAARGPRGLPGGARRRARGRPMTAVVLAAGVGKRLLDASGGRPKCLIEIGGRSLLRRLLESLAAAGVSQAVVVAGFGDGEVRAALARPIDGIAVRCLINSRFREGAILSLWTARDTLDGDVLI